MDNRKNNEDKVKKFIAESLKNKNSDIYKSDGKPSPGKLVKLLKSKTGITITRQTMATYLKDDLSAYATSTDFSTNAKIIEIKAAMTIAKELYESDTTKPGDKTRAMNSWRQLNQQLIDYEANLREIEIRKVEAGKPVQLIRIEPGAAMCDCPYCQKPHYSEGLPMEVTRLNDLLIDNYNWKSLTQKQTQVIKNVLKAKSKQEVDQLFREHNKGTSHEKNKDKNNN